MLVFLSIWVLVYASHPNRGYLLKDPPSVVKQFPSKDACEADGFFHGSANIRRCVEVKATPSCYNDGSVCKFDPANGADADLLEQMVPWPE